MVMKKKKRGKYTSGFERSFFIFKKTERMKMLHKIHQHGMLPIVLRSNVVVNIKINW